MSEKDKEPTGPPPQAARAMTDLQRRLRVLEERYTTLRRKGQLLDENFLETEEDLRERVSGVDKELTELHRMLADIDDKLDRFLEQVKSAAPREEVLILKKYLEMFDPVQYLTQEEAHRLIDEYENKQSSSDITTK
jgi:chromosome segregation ATPase